ncbi:MAG: hypothetical protein ACOZB3_10380 [Calditrichota bacterium]
MMKTRALIFCAALPLLTASLGWAQGFSALLSNFSVPLYDQCGAGNELPDGLTVEIVHDVDLDGPDWTDPLATVCDAPPECATGPVGTVNFNSFALNGQYWGANGGMFYSASAFTSSADLPSPNRFYLRICVDIVPGHSAYYIATQGHNGGGPLTNFSPPTGPSEWEFDTWTCVSLPCYFPVQVTGVNASDSSGAYCWGVRVTWDVMSAIDSFVVKRDGLRIGISLGTATTYNDSLAEPGVLYSYAVTAYNSLGVGEESDTDWGSRKALPGSVANLSATGDRCPDIYLLWNNTAHEDSFRIFRNDEFLAVTMANDTDYYDTTAPIDAFSEYRVLAVNVCGAGDTSNIATGYRYMYPSVVSDLEASSGQCNGIAISWAPSQGHLSGYIIYRNDIIIDTVGSLITNYLDATVPGGFSEYKLAAYSVYCGSSALSEPVIGYRLVSPPIPSNVSATDDNGEWCGSVTVTWDNVELESGFLLRRNGSFLGFVPADCTVFIDYPPAGRYDYSVQSFNECGASYTSVPDSGTAMTLASANLNAALGDNCENITLEWTSTPNADSIRIIRDSDVLLTISAADSTFVDVPAAPGTHDYWIIAVNECGDSPPSDTLSAALLEYPSAPAGLIADDDHCDEIYLSWTAPAGAYGMYNLYKDDLLIASVPQAQTTWTDTAVIGGVSYAYQVSAYNDTCGESERSAPLIAELTDMEPLATPQVVITIEGANARLYWNAISETLDGCPALVTGYLVFYSPQAEGPFYYHGFTTDTSYVHQRAVQFAVGMHYNVVAYAGALEPVLEIEEGILREQVTQRLHR